MLTLYDSSTEARSFIPSCIFSIRFVVKNLKLKIDLLVEICKYSVKIVVS
jgi:hypothetical protein